MLDFTSIILRRVHVLVAKICLCHQPGPRRSMVNVHFPLLLESVPVYRLLVPGLLAIHAVLWSE